MTILASVFVILSVGLCQRGKVEGAVINPLIVDGQNADIRDYPYIVSFMYKGAHQCGASILSKNYVVTAAHCTYFFLNQIDQLSIRAGSSYLGNGGSIYRIMTITQHPNYDDNIVDYDVAIIKTLSSITYDSTKQPIPLARRMPSADAIGVVAGWGSLATAASLAYQLQIIEAPIISRDKCTSIYGTVVNDRMFCAGDLEERGTCYGDSGGPLTVDGSLVGLVSASNFLCAQSGKPTLYASVPYFYNWIKSNVIFD